MCWSISTATRPAIGVKWASFASRQPTLKDTLSVNMSVPVLIVFAPSHLTSNLCPFYRNKPTARRRHAPPAADHNISNSCRDDY